MVLPSSFYCLLAFVDSYVPVQDLSLRASHTRDKMSVMIHPPPEISFLMMSSVGLLQIYRPLTTWQPQSEYGTPSLQRDVSSLPLFSGESCRRQIIVPQSAESDRRSMDHHRDPGGACPQLIQTHICIPPPYLFRRHRRSLWAKRNNGNVQTLVLGLLSVKHPVHPATIPFQVQYVISQCDVRHRRPLGEVVCLGNFHAQ